MFPHIAAKDRLGTMHQWAFAIGRFGDDDLENMKAAANVKTDKKAEKNDYTESLRRAAGLV